MIPEMITEIDHFGVRDVIERTKTNGPCRLTSLKRTVGMCFCAVELQRRRAVELLKQVDQDGNTAKTRNILLATPGKVCT